MARVLAAVSAGGTLGGRHILSPQNALALHQGRGVRDALGVSWALGTRSFTVQDVDGHQYSNVFGACAPGGSMVLCDAGRGLSLCIMTNRLEVHRDAVLRVVDHVFSFFGVGKISRDLD